MQKTSQTYGVHTVTVYQTGTLVIGSGCGGLAAADYLFDFGQQDILIITEGVNMGTSRNAGSDKQTFYKLSLAADELDSVGEMAQTLFSCGGINGDTALAEASCSARCFMKLVQYGVPFPTDRYGAYIGYKTDHDPRRRATSAGPYTSKYMTECLERSVRAKGIPILESMCAVRLLVYGGRCYGVLAVDGAQSGGTNKGLTIFLANHTILATGGPASAYESSVYPESQTGMTGMAVEAGASMQNLMDWQYGLASIKFRWNVSGTYQQALPRYISVSPDGQEREFLTEYYSTPQEVLDRVFLKGYQWPFDVRKLDGSSMIDILVYQETQKGNRVYMDFTQDPVGLPDGFSMLSRECRDYLDRSGGICPYPVERLTRMNAPAVQLYLDHSIDLRREPLEIRVCAQHCCGGIAVDANWQTDIPHLYAVGEAAGTFGAYRPGGMALASTQTGALRAAEHISHCTPAPMGVQALAHDREAGQFIQSLLALSKKPSQPMAENSMQKLQSEFTRYAGHLRDTNKMRQMLSERTAGLSRFFHDRNACIPSDLSNLLHYRDIMFTQGAALSAMLLSAQHMGSRGSGLVVDPAYPNRYLPENIGFQDKYIRTSYKNGQFRSTVETVRPLPDCDSWFETTWKEFRERQKLPSH